MQRIELLAPYRKCSEHFRCRGEREGGTLVFCDTVTTSNQRENLPGGCLCASVVNYFPPVPSLKLTVSRLMRGLSEELLHELSKLDIPADTRY